MEKPPAHHPIYPEKIAVYFATLNPLAAKILSDVQAVQMSPSSDTGEKLTFAEKSRLIDKHLIYDVLQRHKAEYPQFQDNASGKLDEDGNCTYDDVELDKDHEQALLASVYPKPAEKYIYDDNIMYLDEHSEPFNYCTPSQASYCQLEKLLKKVPNRNQNNTNIMNRVPSAKHIQFQRQKSDAKSRPDTTPSTLGRTAGVERRASHRENKKPAPPAPNQNNSIKPPNNDSSSRRPSSGEYDSDNTRYSAMNSSSMESVLESPTKSKLAVKGVPVFGGVSMFPQSPSSSSSIGKQGADSSKKYTGAGNSHDDESNLPKQVRNLDLMAELQAKLKLKPPTVAPPAPPQQQQQPQPSSPSASKVTKPKAPPPPPPTSRKVPGTAVKVTSPKPASQSKPDSPKPVDKVAKESNEDFKVDLSSPCRIATPKTGCDFLDNW